MPFMPSQHAKRTPPAIIAAVLGAAILTTPMAQAGVSISGSLASSSTNVPLQTAVSTYGSASVDIDMGRFVRLGLTYGEEYQRSRGWKKIDPATHSVATKTDPLDCVSASACALSISTTHIIENSVGLTIILWEGQILMPFIMVGAITKTYTFQIEEGGTLGTTTGKEPVMPNLGAGVGIRLNRQFTLKISQQASPGIALQAGDEKPRSVWDRRMTLGLSYQL